MQTSSAGACPAPVSKRRRRPGFPAPRKRPGYCGRRNAEGVGRAVRPEARPDPPLPVETGLDGTVEAPVQDEDANIAGSGSIVLRDKSGRAGRNPMAGAAARATAVDADGRPVA